MIISSDVFTISYRSQYSEFYNMYITSFKFLYRDESVDNKKVWNNYQCLSSTFYNHWILSSFVHKRIQYMQCLYLDQDLNDVVIGLVKNKHIQERCARRGGLLHGLHTGGFRI